MELNDLLMAKDSLAAGTRPYVSSTQFDTNYAVPTGAINYTNLTKDARTYDAIVSLSGELGTFKDIQLAINYVNSLGGGKILIKKGRHILGTSITLYDNIYLIGEDKYSSYIDFNDINYAFKAYGTIGAYKNNITIENMGLINGGAPGYGCFDLRYVNNFTMKNCYAEDVYDATDEFGSFIYISNSNQIIFENNYLTDVDGAISIIRSSKIKVSNNQIYNPSGTKVVGAISVTDCSDATIENNLIDSVINDAPISVEDSTAVYVSQNTLVDCDYGIYVNKNSDTASCNRVEVTNNIAYSVTGTPYYFSFIYNTNNAVINGNIYNGTATNGIMSNNCDNVTFSNNVINSCGTALSLGTGNDRNVVVGNVMNNNGTSLVNYSTNGTVGLNITA